MKNSDIENLVKKLETYFFGYRAQERTLVNDNGMTLSFYSSWNNKTTVSGLGGYHSHTIGCSFSKPLEKIAKDINRRIIPKYKDDFFKKKKDRIETKERKKEE